MEKIKAYNLWVDRVCKYIEEVGPIINAPSSAMQSAPVLDKSPDVIFLGHDAREPFDFNGADKNRFFVGNPEFIPNRHKWVMWNRLDKAFRRNGLERFVTDGNFMLYGELESTDEIYMRYFDMLLDYNVNAQIPGTTIEGFVSTVREYYEKITADFAAYSGARIRRDETCEKNLIALAEWETKRPDGYYKSQQAKQSKRVMQVGKTECVYVENFTGTPAYSKAH